MSKGLKVLGIALLLSVAVASLAADASYPRVGKAWNIEFIVPMHVGAVVLPPGFYKVQHLMDGDKHFLVFKNSGNQEKARVTCTFEPLAKKANHTMYETRKNDAGHEVLESVEFAGDRFRHEHLNQ